MRIVPLPPYRPQWFILNSRFFDKLQIFEKAISMLIDAWQDLGQNIVTSGTDTIKVCLCPVSHWSRREKSSFCSSFLTQRGVKRNDVTFGFLLMIKPPYKFYEYFKYILHQSSKNKSLSLNSLTYLSRSIAPLGRQVICLLKRKITAGNNFSWSMTFKKKIIFL